LIDNNMVIILF